MPPTDFQKLQFYRDEVKHEFNLLAMRVTILVTCQSFLIVPFAILHTAQAFLMVSAISLAIAVLGIYTSWLIQEPIEAAHRTMAKWLMKHRVILQTSTELADLKIDRDASHDIESDKDHQSSLAFSKYAPNAFIIFWIFAVLEVMVRSAIELWQR